MQQPNGNGFLFRSHLPVSRFVHAIACLPSKSSCFLLSRHACRAVHRLREAAAISSSSNPWCWRLAAFRNLIAGGFVSSEVFRLFRLHYGQDSSFCGFYVQTPSARPVMLSNFILFIWDAAYCFVKKSTNLLIIINTSK
jgi:hypothetical protein